MNKLLTTVKSITFIMMKKTVLSIFFLLVVAFVSGQQLFYQNLCNCGITGAGFSTGQGSGSGSFDIYIESGSTIKKAYLFAQRFGEADSVSVIMNGVAYNFNNNNQVTSNYFITATGNSAVHAIDVTVDINPNITNYNITIPTQINTTIPVDATIADANIKYGAIYLWVEYEKPILPLTNSVILLNEFNLNRSIINYSAKNLTPIDTSNPVGFAIYTDRIGDTLSQLDGSYIHINTNLLGLIGGTDAVDNLWAGGVKGHFYYQNNTLFGMDDDTPDSLMSASDGLANISSYLNNNDTAFNFSLHWQNQFTNSAYNLYQGFLLNYTTPCDTFTTTITANDTICLGESVQLQATGGVQYSWFGAFGGLNDTSIATPIATPTQTTTYIVTIKNDSSCVKTEQVKIWVNPMPVTDTIIATNTTCGDTVGSISVGAINNGGQPFNYNLLNLMTQNSIIQTNNTFNQLDSGFYLLTINDNNGCAFTDIIELEETNNVVANFTATPDSGIAPLAVDFDNLSVNANAFMWRVMGSEYGDTLTQNSSFNTQYLFEQSGSFETCLIAYHNIPRCADTLCKTVIVTDEINLIIPNVFTPNGDNNNDLFVLQITGANLIEALNVEVFNRWGEVVNVTNFQSFNNFSEFSVWDGRTSAGSIASEGTYFYVINYTTINDKTETLKGSLTILR